MKQADPRYRFNDGNRWADHDQIRFSYLWWEYLQISPSYVLAHRERTGALTEADHLRLPADFDVVLSVYDNLGPLHEVTFIDWWRDKGATHFGYRGSKPSIHYLGGLAKEFNDPLASLTRKAEDYIKGAWVEQGLQRSAIVSIPLGMPRSRILREIDSLISRFREEDKVIDVAPPTYLILNVKKDYNSLFRYLEVIWTRCAYWPAKLFEVGVIAQLSTAYSLRIAKGEGTAEDKHALKILTSRAVYRGLMIAENAARGVFPSYSKCQHAVKADWLEMRKALNCRIEWDGANG